MRIVLQNYGDCVLYAERPFGYRRFIVEWPTHTQLFSSIWYKEEQVRQIIEEKLNADI